MTDILARQRQLIGTTAEWGADDLVLGNGEIAVERVSATEIKIKIGDGVNHFSTLPYVAGGTTGGAGGAITAAGGTLTGPLVLPAGAPTGRQAVSKEEADKLYVLVSKLIAASAGAASSGRVPQLNAMGKLDSSFLSITGGMVFHGVTDPTAAAPATPAAGDYYFASKNATLGATWTGLVGAAVKANDSLLFDGTNWHSVAASADLSAFVEKSGGTMTGPLNIPLVPATVTEATSKDYVDKELAKKAALVHTHPTLLPLTGGTLTGDLTLAGAPTTALMAATKGYVDAKRDTTKVDVANLVDAGGAGNAGKVPKLDAAGRIPSTMLPAAVVGAMSFKGSVSPVSAAPAGAAQGDFYMASVAGSATWAGITGQAIKVGDSLIFDGTNWHAIPAESDLAAYLPLAGGTMSGPIVLSAAPAADMQAATKKYVDDTLKAASGGTGAAVPLAGGTMTGLLVLSGAPTADLNAATKKYVDDQDALKLDKTLLVTAAGTAAQASHIIALDAAGKIPASALPVAGNMSFKGTADVTAAVPAGVASGNYYLAAANAVAGAGWTGIVGQSLKAGDALVYDGAAWHAMAQNIDLTGYLPLAGGTVTGAINLPAATPTVATQAVSKGYVDSEVAKKALLVHTHSYLPLAGGTVTGPIVLPAAAPTADNQAANKAYVDAEAAKKADKTHTHTEYMPKTDFVYPANINGLIITWVDARKISIGVGSCSDSAGDTWIVSKTPLIKTLDAWAAGTNKGMFDGHGALGTNGIDLFLIYNPTTKAVDVLAANSIALGTAPALPAGFTKYRRFISVFHKSVALGIQQFVQIGDAIESVAPAASLLGQGITGTPSQVAIPAPPHPIVVNMVFSVSSTLNALITIASKTQAIPSVATGFHMYSPGGPNYNVAQVEVRTDDATVWLTSNQAVLVGAAYVNCYIDTLRHTRAV